MISIALFKDSGDPADAENDDCECDRSSHYIVAPGSPFHLVFNLNRSLLIGVTLNLELLSFGQTDFNLSISLQHNLETVLDFLFGGSQLVEDSESLISVGVILIPFSCEFLKLVSELEE